MEATMKLSALAFVFGGYALCALPAFADNERCEGARDVALVNGRIHTMDQERSVVEKALIRDGRFVAVGHKGADEHGPCTQVINLHGRTAIPGLIDNHVHFLRLQNL